MISMKLCWSAGFVVILKMNGFLGFLFTRPMSFWHSFAGTWEWIKTYVPGFSRSDFPLLSAGIAELGVLLWPLASYAVWNVRCFQLAFCIGLLLALLVGRPVPLSSVHILSISCLDDVLEPGDRFAAFHLKFDGFLEYLFRHQMTSWPSFCWDLEMNGDLPSWILTFGLPHFTGSSCFEDIMFWLIGLIAI